MKITQKVKYVRLASYSYIICDHGLTLYETVMDCNGRTIAIMRTPRGQTLEIASMSINRGLTTICSIRFVRPLLRNA